ncbi:hypothetical protein [Rhodococcus triatomae]
MLRNGTEIGKAETFSSITTSSSVTPAHVVWLLADSGKARRIAAFRPDQLTGEGEQRIALDPKPGERRVIATTELSSDAIEPTDPPFLSVSLE